MDTNKQLEANKFEEQVYDYFNDVWNISLSHYVSKEGQYKRGENRQGVEIKNDQMYSKTGNLYISIKRVYQHTEYPSGVYRETDTKQRFYTIGDKNKFWIISSKHLQEYHQMQSPKETSGFKTATGGIEYGFLLPINMANLMAIDIFSKQLVLI
tara:strand:+ start:3970 stop:4431 length:462 start_codon:yes stop_codon:yes gene_type:complete